MWNISIILKMKNNIKKYVKLIKNYRATIIYNKSQGIKYGRVNSSKGSGMHCLRCKLGIHYFKTNLYIDGYILNCHPNMLYQVCKKNNINFEFLGQYILK